MAEGSVATRREALRAGFAGAGALLAASMGAVPGTGTAWAKTAEAVPLAIALRHERDLVLAYEAGEAGELLDPPVARLVAALLDQERQHVARLEDALERLAGRPTSTRKPEEVEGLAGLGTQEELLRLAVRLERVAVAAYIEAHRRLRDDRSLELVAQIVASEGQHLAALREALGEQPVPDAFESGRGTIRAQ